VSLPPLVEPAADLSVDEVKRYSRHLIIPDVGMAGQKRLKNAKVLVVGAGGLGSPALLYLAAAGVGTLGVVDDDVVALSNLQRQVIHATPDVGVAKVDSAAATIHLDTPLPGASSGLPAGSGERPSNACATAPWVRPSWPCFGWGLPSHSGHPECWCALTAPFHPYHHEGGGLFSVALSRESPRIAVSNHPAL